MDHDIATTIFDGPVAVVVDGSPTDKGVAEWAANFAHAASTSVHLVHAAPRDQWSAAIAAELDTTNFPTRLRHESEGVLARAVDVVHGVDSGVPVESAVYVSQQRYWDREARTWCITPNARSWWCIVSGA